MERKREFIKKKFNSCTNRAVPQLDFLGELVDDLLHLCVVLAQPLQQVHGAGATGDRAAHPFLIEVQTVVGFGLDQNGGGRLPRFRLFCAARFSCQIRFGSL